MINLQNIAFAYSRQQHIFQNYSWEVKPGETWAILGSSGCGKSTLLFLLAGLLKPLTGNIIINGNPLERPRPHTGLIIQEYGLLPWATVKQNAELGLEIRKYYGPDGTHAPKNIHPKVNVEHWLSRLRLNPHADKYPSQLSGGQRQRTAIARTLAMAPDLILMDEPFSSLDAPTRESLQNLTVELQKEQSITMVIVTHSIEEASFLGRKVLVLSNPPNTFPIIIENPAAGKPDYRNSADHISIRRDLHSLLEKDGMYDKHSEI
jgi:NitT/TauT family transport system ATP-binding protein